MSDLSIINEYNDYYQEAYYAWNPFYPLADRDLRFYLGEQWDEQERQKLFDEGRNSFSFNLIRSNINLLTGYQRKHRNSSVVVPTESSDQRSADQLSQLLLYAMNHGEGYKFISEAFGGAMKTGFNLLSIWMDYRDDPINGDIRYGREPYNGFITDPYFTQLDFSDCSYVIRRKYLAPQQVSSLLPGQQKEIEDLHKTGWSRDDKFTWLPYQTQPNGQDFMAYNEFYKQGWEEVSMIVDEETGEYLEWEGDRDGLKFYLSQFPQVKEIKKPKRYIECNIIVNDVLMRTEKNQYGLNEYPFVPVVGIFEPESEFWGLKMQSLVRPQIDPQRETNKRRSQMIDILDSNINSGWIAKKEAVVNPRSLFQSSQGKVVWLTGSAEPGDVERIQPAQIPPGMFELQKQFDQDIQTVVGINDAAFGEASNKQESGLMMMLRQSASVVNLQDLYDNLRYAQKLISQKTLKLLQTWTPEKVKRVTNSETTEQFYSKDFIKYDVSVQEGLLTDTQRQLYFRQLLDLYEVTGGPQGGVVTADMLAKAAPIQGKTEFNEQIEQNMKQQQQQAEEAKKKQDQLMQSQLELNKSSAIERLSSASERRGRLHSDLALSTERISESEENRSMAALNRAKTIAEVDQMSDDRILKLWKFVNELERQETLDRELIGAKVAAQAEAIKREDPLSLGQSAPARPLSDKSFSGVDQ